MDYRSALPRIALTTAMFEQLISLKLAALVHEYDRAHAHHDKNAAADVELNAVAGIARAACGCLRHGAPRVPVVAVHDGVQDVIGEDRKGILVTSTAAFASGCGHSGVEKSHERGEGVFILVLPLSL